MTTKNEPDSRESVPKSDPGAEDEDSDGEEEEILVFTPYNKDSWEEQIANEHRIKLKEEENKRNQGEAHLVDGELHFDSEEHHGPQKTRNPNLVEGNTLKEDTEPEFPKELYGKPIEEIDKLIKDNDKVSRSIEILKVNQDTLQREYKTIYSGILGVRGSLEGQDEDLLG